MCVFIVWFEFNINLLFYKTHTNIQIFKYIHTHTTQPVVEAFALDVFQKADGEDRSGLADKGTARTFYAAGNFLDVLQQFGELSDDFKQMKKYAKWKAADILSAIKEGRAPTPGGFGEETSRDEEPSFGAAAAGVIPEAPTAAPKVTPLVSDVASFESLIPQAPGISPVSSYNHHQPPLSFIPGYYGALPPPASAAAPYTPPPPPAAAAASTAYTPPSALTPAAPVPAPIPASVSAPRTPTTRPKDAAVNDAIELCNFAIAALKVIAHMLLFWIILLFIYFVKCVPISLRFYFSIFEFEWFKHTNSTMKWIWLRKGCMKRFEDSGNSHTLEAFDSEKHMSRSAMYIPCVSPFILLCLCFISPLFWVMFQF